MGGLENCAVLSPTATSNPLFLSLVGLACLSVNEVHFHTAHGRMGTGRGGRRAAAGLFTWLSEEAHAATAIPTSRALSGPPSCCPMTHLVERRGPCTDCSANLPGTVRATILLPRAALVQVARGGGVDGKPDALVAQQRNELQLRENLQHLRRRECIRGPIPFVETTHPAVSGRLLCCKWRCDGESPLLAHPVIPAGSFHPFGRFTLACPLVRIRPNC